MMHPSHVHLLQLHCCRFGTLTFEIVVNTLKLKFELKRRHGRSPTRRRADLFSGTGRASISASGNHGPPTDSTNASASASCRFCARLMLTPSASKSTSPARLFLHHSFGVLQRSSCCELELGGKLICEGCKSCTDLTLIMPITNE